MCDSNNLKANDDKYMYNLNTKHWAPNCSFVTPICVQHSVYKI